MGFTSRSDSETTVQSNNTKVLAHEAALQQTFVSFKDLVLEFEQLQLDSENYRVQYFSLKEKCENKTCTAVEELKKVVATKDLIIQSVASILTRLNETKNFNILADAFKVIFEEEAPLTPPLDKSPAKTPEKNKPSLESEQKEIKKEMAKDESICEIDGTPTGRTSPILNAKKSKTSFVKSSDFRDKKKCPSDWPTPESKAVKLIYPGNTPSRKGTGKLRQTRLDVVTVKQTTTVDLTVCADLKPEPYVQPLIKKESIENDDTILPSPTSGPTNYSLLKTTSKPSPSKFKKPLSLKNKTDKSPKQDENVILKDTKLNDMDVSINILNPLAKRIKSEFREESPIKMEPIEDDDVTNCEDYSLLMQIDRIEADCMKENASPAKRPLTTNMNVLNTPPKDGESSMSILRPETGKNAVDKVKRKLPDPVEPIYKEPTVRKAAEKRALQGWSCEECKNFYGALYANDPVMLAAKISDCSKHRAKHNPTRPKTPPNYWNPRWSVPNDTDQLNLMNNAT